MGNGIDEALAARLSPDLQSKGAIVAARTGFWSALVYAGLLVALNLSFTVMALQLPASGWQGLEAYAGAHRAIDFVPQAIGLVAIPPLIVMLASIHVCAGESRKALSLAGLAFGAASTGLLGSLYFIQVCILWPALRHGDWQGLDQFAFANPRSIAWGLNHFAWSLLGVGLLLTAWVFEGRGLARWIRWLFLLNGLANSSLIFAFAFRIEALTLGVAFVSWVVALPVAAVLVALRFRGLRFSLETSRGRIISG